MSTVLKHFKQFLSRLACQKLLYSWRKRWSTFRRCSSVCIIGGILRRLIQDRTQGCVIKRKTAHQERLPETTPSSSPKRSSQNPSQPPHTLPAAPSFPTDYLVPPYMAIQSSEPQSAMPPHRLLHLPSSHTLSKRFRSCVRQHRCLGSGLGGITLRSTGRGLDLGLRDGTVPSR